MLDPDELEDLPCPEHCPECLSPILPGDMCAPCMVVGDAYVITELAWYFRQAKVDRRAPKGGS